LKKNKTFNLNLNQYIYYVIIIFLLFQIHIYAENKESHFDSCDNCCFFSGTTSCWEGVSPKKWISNGVNTYSEWMDEASNAKSSRKKIYCYSKAFNKAKNNKEKSNAIFYRGYAQYYYTLDMTGETWEKDTHSSDDNAPVDKGMGDSVTQESSVSRNLRKDKAYKDYKQAIKNNHLNSDAHFECGVYWYWKAFRQEAKEKGKHDEEEKSGEYQISNDVRKKYNKAITYLTKCIILDKFCSTAYDIRNRAYKKLKNQDESDKNIKIRNILRHCEHTQKERGSGITGYYCDNKSLTALRFKRKSSQISFDWGSSKIDSIIGANDVSIKWIGMLEIPKSGNYKFRTYSDDGAKLYINHEVIIDDWNDHGPRWKNSDSINFNTNNKLKRVLLVLEWYEHKGGATIKLDWKIPDGNWERIPKKYLYPIPTPASTKLPRFWQGEKNYFSKDIYSNSDSPNETLWYLDLDAGTYNLTGDFNDNLSAFQVPELYKVTIMQHVTGGKTYSVTGPANNAHASDYSWKKNEETLTLNDRTSRIIIENINGFGQ